MASIHYGRKNLKETKMIKYIEIRQAEGGEDSRLFVDDLARTYIRMATKLA